MSNIVATEKKTRVHRDIDMRVFFSNNGVRISNTRKPGSFIAALKYAMTTGKQTPIYYHQASKLKVIPVNILSLDKHLDGSFEFKAKFPESLHRKELDRLEVVIYFKPEDNSGRMSFY